MTITEELKASDYYLFIDFCRNGKDDLACSLFTHQELALAHQVGFRDVIAIQEEGAPMEGFLRYVLSNPEHFNTEEELLQKVEYLVRDKKWNKDYSRNLIVSELEKKGVFLYSDHTGNIHPEYIWHVKITNRRPDRAAVNTVCALDSTRFPDGTEQKSDDRSFLKWARQDTSYLTTILPQDFALLDAFAIHADEQGVFLHSTLDQDPRLPTICTEGKHKLTYKLFADGFPLLRFSIEVNYHGTTHYEALATGQLGEPTKLIWSNNTEAHLVT